MRLRLVVLLAALAAGGCTSVEPTRFQASSPAVRAAAGELEAFAREGWHLPLRVRVFLSNAGDGRPLEVEQAAREERLVRAQLEEVRAAYAASPFDLYALDVVVSDGRRRRMQLSSSALRLELVLPAPRADEDLEPHGAEQILRVWTRGYSYRRDARWYAGERTDSLEAALRRDAAKLLELRSELEREVSRLALLAGSAEARAAVAGREVTLTPSESGYARQAQLAALLALHRTLNTMARWQRAAADPVFSRRAEALLVAYAARLLHEGALGGLLELLVGGRPTLAVWTDAWWSRNPLYRLLDGEATLVAVAGREPGHVPAGSVRALLALRLDGSLRRSLRALDALWGERGGAAASARGAAHGGGAEPDGDDAFGALRAALPALEALVDERAVSDFVAWKELWDARLKDGFHLPFYALVRSVSRFLGDTRVARRAPRVSEAQLRALEARLAPGDVLLVRQEHYLSNAFLPGFWPHALLYLGPEEAWTRLRLPDGTSLGEDPLVRRLLPAFRAPTDGGAARVIEAVSEGVVFSSMAGAAQKDYVLALRPDVAEEERAAAIRRALALYGRPYDFDFDFATDDKIVCTELIYRAYDRVLNFRVGVDRPRDDASGAGAVPGVLRILGRLSMPANELARYALYMQDTPEPAPRLGYPGRRLSVVTFLDDAPAAAGATSGSGRGVAFFEGEEALRRLRESLDR